MEFKVVHQILAGASPGDAISNFAFEIQLILKDVGLESEIFAPMDDVSPLLHGKIKPIQDLTQMEAGESLVLYHFSIGSKAVDFFLSFRGKRGIIYHNITPSKYFLAFSDSRASILRKGREQLATLCDQVDFSLCASNYNRQELVDLGFRSPKMIPMVVCQDYLETPPDQRILNQFGGSSYQKFLFVGRIVPNKRFEDLLKVFYYYQNTINPQSQLFIVGSYIGMEDYYKYLKGLCFEMGLERDKHVFFSGHVVLRELLAYYQICDLFLCLSEHEGFCVPLLEAMYFNKPIAALNRAAVCETLGESGIQFNRFDPLKIAHFLHKVLENPELLKKICHMQNQRLKEFTKDSLKDSLLEHLISL